MKVKELLEQLKDCDPEAVVVLQKDSEGNGYSPLCGADPDCIYVAESSWSGEVHDIDMEAEDAGYDEESWETLKEVSPRAVVLWPIN